MAGVGGGDVRALLAQFSFFWAGVVLFLTAALMFSGERKWALLDAAWHGYACTPPASGFYRRHYLWQNWVGQFVPPSLAIVLGRGWAARCRHGTGALSGVTNGLFDQLMDLALLCAFLPAGAFVVWGGAGWLGFLLGSGAGIGMAALAGFVLRRWLSAPLQKVFWSLFGLSAARIVLLIVRLLAGVYAFGFSFPLLDVAALTPMVGLVALIPLTPGNLGLAEWGWVGGLVYVGGAAQEAALYALGFRLLVLVAQTVLLGLNEAHVRFRKTNPAL